MIITKIYFQVNILISISIEIQLYNSINLIVNLINYFNAKYFSGLLLMLHFTIKKLFVNI